MRASIHLCATLLVLVLCFASALPGAGQAAGSSPAAATLYVPPPNSSETPPMIIDFLYRYAGDSVTFEVVATGGDLHYQWFWQGQAIEGATGSTLTYTNAAVSANAGYYTIYIWNSLGDVWAPGTGLLFTKPVVTGTYKGVFDGEDPNATGFFTFTLSQSRRSYSGFLVIGNRRLPFSGAFSKAQISEAKIPLRKGTPDYLILQLLSADRVPGVSGEIFFTGDAGDRLVAVRGYRESYNSKNPPPQAGKYTMAFHNPSATYLGASPDGNGYASVLVTRSGGVGISGRTADGAPIVYSRGGLSKTGECPVYASLYGNRGYMVGWLAFTNSSTGSLSGDVRWHKGRFGSSYPDGFVQDLQIVGSSYHTVEVQRDWRRPLTAAWIPFTTATATFTGGEMFSPETAVWDFVKVYTPTPNRIWAQGGPEKLYLEVNPLNGKLSGNFRNHAGRQRPLRGILLQEQGGALGYFLSGKSSDNFLSGYFAIEAGN
jgi:hypothetical protein